MTEGDIFKGFGFSLALLRNFFSMRSFKACESSKPYRGCPNIVVPKEASMVAAVEKMHIRVGWIDKVLGELTAKRNHFALLREAGPTRGALGAETR